MSAIIHIRCECGQDLAIEVTAIAPTLEVTDCPEECPACAGTLDPNELYAEPTEGQARRIESCR